MAKKAKKIKEELVDNSEMPRGFSEPEEQKRIKVITSFEDIDSSAMVNIIKAQRAFKAVFGGAKAGSAENVLNVKLAGQFPDKEELVLEIYKGLRGLLNVAKAKKNRENEEKDKLRKASK